MELRRKPQTSEWLDQVIIRHLTRSDLPALEWEGEYQHYRRVYAEAYNRVEAGALVMWGADLLGVGLIGQVFIQLLGSRTELADGIDRAYLYSFRIRPAYQGMGLGKRILSVVEEDLRQRDFRWLTLNVAKDNLRAQKLYRRDGFRIVAHEPGEWSYLDDKGAWRTVREPAWRMEKYLLEGQPPR